MRLARGLRLWRDRRCRALDRSLLDLPLVHRLVAPLPRPGLVDPRRDHADLDVLTHAIVDHGPADDVRLGVRGGVDDLGRLVDLEQREVRTAGDREPHAARPVDRLLQQRRLDRLAGGIGRARLAGAVSDAHEGGARVRHDRLHVGEVEVDEAGHGDEIADALDPLPEHIVDDAERVDHAGALLDDLEETVVRDRDERVDLVAEIADPLLRADHAIDGVRSAAADTDDLDESEIFYVAPEGHGQSPNHFHAAAPPLTAAARSS